MPRTEEEYEAMRIVTRNKIHAAGIKLFAKKGFAATSVKEIAEGAGISVGLIYRHYKTKEDLFNELVSYAVEGLERIVKRFQSDESPVVIIQKFTTEILNDIKKNDEFADFLMLMNQSITMENPSLQIENLNKQSEDMMYQTARLIEKGQNLGQFHKGNASEMAYFYFASIQGIAMMKIMVNEGYITPNLQIVTAFLIKNSNG